MDDTEGVAPGNEKTELETELGEELSFAAVGSSEKPCKLPLRAGEGG
jgi:hypothetical protein